jgi:branched-chain amino acid transport system ATP-binding protein
MMLLEISTLTKHFGGLAALNYVSFCVNQTEIMGLIGPNGAGKTTLLNVISGVYNPTIGRIIFEGKDISGLQPHAVAKKGIIRTYQANVLFKDLNVLDNVKVGHHLQAKAGFLGFFSNSKLARRETEEIENNAKKIIGFCGLEKQQNEFARNLPHGHQKMLGIAIALAAKPKLLLLDEPMTGMNVEEASHVIELIRRLKHEGMTILLIEHDMNIIMNLCERIVVLNFGEKLAEGTPEEIKSNEKVIKAYLGGSEEWAKIGT